MPRVRYCILRCKGYKSLYEFPKDEDRRRTWLEAFEMVDSKQRYLFACNRHFSPEMICVKHLKKTAYPDINVPNAVRRVPLIEQVWFANSCEPETPKDLDETVIETLEPFSTISNQLIVVDRKVQADQQDSLNLGKREIMMKHMINRLQSELNEREHTIQELKLQIQSQNSDLEDNFPTDQL